MRGSGGVFCRHFARCAGRGSGSGEVAPALDLDLRIDHAGEDQVPDHLVDALGRPANRTIWSGAVALVIRQQFQIGPHLVVCAHTSTSRSASLPGWQAGLTLRPPELTQATLRFARPIAFSGGGPNPTR